MKVYRIPAGTYFEKQEDARKADRNFEPVEFPFAASPKGDFVAWLNARAALAEEAVEAAVWEEGFNADYPHGVGQPQPKQPDPAISAQIIAFEDQFERMPLATQLHYAALAVENARAKDFDGTAPAKAPQRYGKDA